MSGPLQTPRALQMNARLSDVQLLLPEYPVRNRRRRWRSRFSAGRLEVGSLHLGGEGTDLVVSGHAPICWAADRSAWTARGAADLRVLSLLTRRAARPRGRAAGHVGLR